MRKYVLEILSLVELRFASLCASVVVVRPSRAYPLLRCVVENKFFGQAPSMIQILVDVRREEFDSAMPWWRALS